MSRPLALALFFAGCATTVRPDDLSAERHRREAARERSLADEDRARFEPGANTSLPGVPAMAPGSPGVAAGVFWGPYNPTVRYLDAAEKHFAHALQHEAAAAALEAFEEGECRGLAPKTRAACPLVGPVAAVEDLANGARIRLAAGASVEETVARMRCHLAFARTRGFERAPDCPLYVRGVAIAATADGAAVEVTAADAAVAATVRRLVHAESGR
jgi:hypothetical protein